MVTTPTIIVVVQLTKPTSSAPVGVDLVSGGDASSPPQLKEARGRMQPSGLLQSADALTRGDERIRAAPDQHLVRVYSADQLVLRFRRPPVSDSPADGPHTLGEPLESYIREPSPYSPNLTL